MQFTLVHNEPSCRKCRDTQAVLEAVLAECPDLCTVRYLTVAEAGQAGLSVVLTPTVLVDGQVLCAGIVPRQAGLLRLIHGN